MCRISAPIVARFARSRGLPPCVALVVSLSACAGGETITERRFDLGYQAAIVQFFVGDLDGDGKKDDGVGELHFVGTTFDDPCAVLLQGPPLEGWGQLVTIDLVVRELDVDLSTGVIRPGGAWEAVGGPDVEVKAGAFEVDGGETVYQAGMPPRGSVSVSAVSEAAVSFTFSGAWTWARDAAGELTNPDPPEAWELAADDVQLCELPEE